ncbi:MAG: CARDB domain-containing protein [Dehalococcoidia bacterium]
MVRMRAGALLIVATIVAALVSGQGAALAQPTSPPARYTGSVSLFGAAAAKTTVKAFVGAVECGRADVKNGAFTINVKHVSQTPGCGTPGATITFTLGEYRAYEYAAWQMVVGPPITLDLNGPVTTDVAIGATECNNIQILQFANKTPVEYVVSSVIPQDALSSLWKWNDKKSDWESYYVGAPKGFNNLKTIDLNDRVWFCTEMSTTILKMPQVVTGTTAQNKPNLTVSVSTAPPLVTPGGAFTYTMRLRNTGGANATGVVAVLRLPPAIADTAVTLPGTQTAGFACTKATSAGQVVVTCQNGALAQSAQADLTVSVQLPAAQPTVGTILSATAQVDPNNTVQESNETDNTATSNLTVSGAHADLVIYGQDAAGVQTPATIEAGSVFTYPIGVANVGQGVANSVTVAVTLDSRLTGMSASGPGWICGIGGSQVTCTLASLGAATAACTMSTPAQALTTCPASVLSVQVQAPAQSGLTLSTTAVVDPLGAIVEVNEGNNSITLQTTTT